MKFTLSLLSFVLFSNVVLAATVELRMRYGERSIVVETKERGLSMFRRFNDLWIVSADEETIVTPDTLTERALGITEIEKLDVQPKGSGVRISFKEMPKSWMSFKEGAYHLLMGAEKPTQIPDEPFDVKLEPKEQDLALEGTDLFGVTRAISLNTREYYFVGLTEKVKPQDKKITGNFIMLPAYVGLSFTSMSGLPVQINQAKSGYMLKTLASNTLRVMADSNKKVVERVVQPELLEQIKKIQENRNLQSPSRQIDLKSKLDLENQSSDYMTAMSSLYDALIRIENFGKKEAMPAPTTPKVALRPNLPTAEELLRRAQNPYEGAARHQMPVALSGDVFLPNYGQQGLKNFYNLEKKYIRFFWSAKTQEEQTEAVLSWAKLKFSLGRYLDAVGILKTAEIGANGLAKNEDVRLLQGVANAAFGRHKDAELLLKTVSEPNADKSLWLSVVYAEQGKYEAAVRGFNAYKDHIKTYPPKTRQLVYYYYALALYETERLDESIDQIDLLATLGNLSDYLPMSQLLLAKVYNAMGKQNIAEQILVNLLSHPYLPAAHGAIYEYVSLLRDKGDISNAQLIEHLENLRYAWRGDATERKTLLRLGEIYIDDKKFEQGLSLLKYLSTYFPESLESQKSTELLTQTFTDLFLKGKAGNSLNLTETLSLYYAFRELTPPGRDGDKLIDSIVNRMRTLNLFARAIELQEHQLHYRAKTEEDKAVAGLKLAQLYLMDLQPEKALEALKQTTTKSKQQASLTKARQQMLAEVYVELGQIENVEKALTGIKGKEADYLRGEVYWRQDASKKFVDIIAPYFAGEEPSELSFHDNLMYRRLMISAALSGNDKLIDRLRTDYPKAYDKAGFGERATFLRQFANESGEVKEVGVENPNPVWKQAAEQLKGFTELEAIYKKERERRRETVTDAQKYFGLKGSKDLRGGTN